MSRPKESTFAYARLCAAERIEDEIEWILSDAVLDEIYSEKDAEALAKNLSVIARRIRKLTKN